jgi:hypothetical protein
VFFFTRLSAFLCLKKKHLRSFENPVQTVVLYIQKAKGACGAQDTYMFMTTNLSDLWPQRKHRPCMPYGKPKNTLCILTCAEHIHKHEPMRIELKYTHTSHTYTVHSQNHKPARTQHNIHTHVYICTHTPARIKTQRDRRATFIGDVWQPRNLPQHVHDSSQQPDQVALLRRKGGMLQRFVYASMHAFCVHMCMGVGPWKSRKRIPQKFELFGRYTRELRRTAL